MAINLDAYNEEVKQWDIESNQDIRSRASSLGVTHRANSPSPSSSIAKLRSRQYMQDGAIARISKVFPRELIWTNKGAGKGRGGFKGSRWVDQYGNNKTTNKESLGKMGTEGRVAKPFFNQSLDGPNGVGKLATIAAEKIGDVLVGSMFIK